MSKSSTTTKAIATPNRVTAHPGEVLNEEFLKPLGMSVDALAIALRVAVTRIGAIVEGERSVAAETALRLARFYGTSSEFWMNLQALHDLTKTRIENGKAIARDVRQRTARVHSPSHVRHHSGASHYSPLTVDVDRRQAARTPTTAVTEAPKLDGSLTNAMTAPTYIAWWCRASFRDSHAGVQRDIFVTRWL